MNELETKLKQLILEACSHQRGSLQRQRNLNTIIQIIYNSGRLWKVYSHDYEDALQITWLYFCRNLCEATTGQAYDSSRSSVITWLNQYLKWRLGDFQRQKIETNNRFSSLNLEQELELPAPPIPPDNLSILPKILEYVKTDSTGELQKIHLRRHPEVNCQILILRRLTTEQRWQDLSAEFSVPVPTLSNFYQKECVPQLRRIGELYKDY